MTDEAEDAPSWFNQAAQSSILNALWLGPLNIYSWFSVGRFEDPYYTDLAEADGTHIDAVIGQTLITEMVLMIVSLFAVTAVFYASRAKSNIFTFIMIMIGATLLWNTLSYMLEL